MGAAFFGERLGWFEIADIGLTLIGIALANGRGLDNDAATTNARWVQVGAQTYSDAGLFVKTLKWKVSAHHPSLGVSAEPSRCAGRV